MSITEEGVSQKSASDLLLLGRERTAAVQRQKERIPVNERANSQLSCVGGFSTCNLILMSSHILVLSVKAGRAVHFSTSINFRLFRTFLLDPNR